MSKFVIDIPAKIFLESGAFPQKKIELFKNPLTFWSRECIFMAF